MLRWWLQRWTRADVMTKNNILIKFGRVAVEPSFLASGTTGKWRTGAVLRTGQNCWSGWAAEG